LSAHAAQAFGTNARSFEDHAALVAALQEDGLGEGVRVLVKGSRGSAMDRVVKALLAADRGQHDAA
jgi:UDP-N-acetylmuramoyl-tripeptide--D-alanyl-D-alanine ligase